MNTCSSIHYPDYLLSDLDPVPIGSVNRDYSNLNYVTVSCQNAFDGDTVIDYVFNCSGETKSGQTDPVYKEGIYKLSMNCAQHAAKMGVERFVEISSGHLSSSEKAQHKEDDNSDPWTFVAKHKLQVEQDLKNIPGLKYTVLRPAIVYGPGDRNGLGETSILLFDFLTELIRDEN